MTSKDFEMWLTGFLHGKDKLFKSDIELIQEKLDCVIETRVEKITPYTPSVPPPTTVPNIPPITFNDRCNVCGIPYKDMTNYYCGRVDCPSGTMTCSDGKQLLTDSKDGE